MAESYVQVPPNSSGDKIATEQQTINSQTVQLQRFILHPGTDPLGASIYHAVALGGGDAANVKASPGNIYGWRVSNRAGYPVYIKLHNTAGTPTPGTGVAQTIGVQAGLDDGDEYPTGLAFPTGIGISIVKGIADNDSTAVTAGDCVVDLFFA